MDKKNKMINFPLMENFIWAKLKNELSPQLQYHGIHHTEDVFKRANYIAQEESIGEIDLLLLQTAVLYHDSGYIVQAKGHEEIGCEIARASLPDFGYSTDDIDKICGMIMATMIPQVPTNLLENIICDADLDYLGREDYDTISETLYQEINGINALSREQWIKIQIGFLEHHHYFTQTSINLRTELKQKKLQLLKGASII